MSLYWKCECGKRYERHINKCFHKCICGKTISENYGTCSKCSIMHKSKK